MSVLDLFLYILLAILSLVTTYLGAHMAVSPPEKARSKKCYKWVFAAICVVTLATIVSIGIRQYRATARADASQKELQDAITEIKQDLQSAEVVRKLNGEGYLQTKDVLTVPGTFLPGKEFKVHVITENLGAARINDPLIVNSLRIEENAGQDANRRVLQKIDELTMRYKTDYLSRNPQAPQVQGSGAGGWATLKYKFKEGDIEALQKDTKRLYVVTLYGWTDSQGQKAFVKDCRYLQAQTVPQSYEEKDIVWQRCQ
jgi:hypothetical protein